METSTCCHNDFYNLQPRIRCMACIWEGFIVWIPQLTCKNSSQTEMVFLINGDMPGPFPPLFVVGYHIRSCCILQNFSIFTNSFLMGIMGGHFRFKTRFWATLKFKGNQRSIHWVPALRWALCCVLWHFLAYVTAVICCSLSSVLIRQNANLNPLSCLYM